VIYLDPHTTQPAGFVEEKEQEHEKAFDASYHCQYASRMHILLMDPSVAAVRKLFMK
jgi:cysteine protease ATG4